MRERERMKKVVRVIFRTFDETNTGHLDYVTRLQLWLIKKFTIPLFYRGHKYDHVEVLTDKKQRFSIRMEKRRKYDMTPKLGVYLVNRNGFDDDEIDPGRRDFEITLNQLLETQKRRYKLIFTFVVNDEQIALMEQFIRDTQGEQYSLKVANWNVFLNKINWLLPRKLVKKLTIDDFSTKPPHSRRWDCVTLIARLLVVMKIIPVTRSNGSDTQILGLSAHGFAQLLLDLSEHEEFYCQDYFIIGEEVLNTRDYERNLDLFYTEDCKVTHTAKKKINK